MGAICSACKSDKSGLDIVDVETSDAGPGSEEDQEKSMMDVLKEEVFSKVERCGPGSEEITKSTFEKCGLQHLESCVVVDVGSENGASAKALVKHFQNIDLLIATDIDDGKVQKINGLNLKNVEARKFSMRDDSRDLVDDFKVDCVWGEGSFHHCGFTSVARNFSKILKSGGYCCASHLCYIENDLNVIPEEMKKFWEENWEEITTLDEFVRTIYRELYDVYELIAYEVLPEKAWENYYKPVEKVIGEMDKELKKGSGIVWMENEISTYRKYKDYYSYVFFILRRR